MPIIIDAHEDLAYNALTFGRDYTLPAAEIRRREQGSPILEHASGDTSLGWDEYQRGQVAVVFGTLFAAPMKRKAADWDSLSYATAEEAHRLYMRQIDYYDRLADEHPDHFRRVLTRKDLDAVLDNWSKPLPERSPDPEDTRPRGHPVGLVTLMEGAEGVREPGELELWWQRGVRLIGPAWAGTRFCGGSGEPGPLTQEGYALLEGMAAFGFVLDISHMDEEAALQALDVYPGRIIASHANASALLKGYPWNRHLSDAVLGQLLERDGIIGVIPFNGFLSVDWRRGDRKDSVPLDRLVAHIDYICQMAGSAQHAALGTDFDGGFGMQDTPAGLDTIADLQALSQPLADRGYTEADIAAIFGGNWLRLLKEILP